MGDALDIIEGLMNSAEAYFILEKSPLEYDEYDSMMAPAWIAARQFLLDNGRLLQI